MREEASTRPQSLLLQQEFQSVDQFIDRSQKSRTGHRRRLKDLLHLRPHVRGDLGAETWREFQQPFLARMQNTVQGEQHVEVPRQEFREAVVDADAIIPPQRLGDLVASCHTSPTSQCV